MSSSAGGRRLPPVVTLAALHGTRGSVVGPRVAERLGVSFLDRAIPSEVAARARLSAQAVTETDEAPRGGWERLVGALARASPATGASEEVEPLELEQRRLRAEMEEFLARASRSGGVVLGRGGAVVLAAVPGALHVYLGGEREARIERVMELHGLDHEAAARRVKATDRARRDYVRSAYRVDGDDPALYHLMLDAVSLGVEACVDLIVSASEHIRTGRGDADVRRGDAQAT